MVRLRRGVYILILLLFFVGVTSKLAMSVDVVDEPAEPVEEPAVHEEPVDEGVPEEGAGEDVVDEAGEEGAKDLSEYADLDEEGLTFELEEGIPVYEYSRESEVFVVVPVWLFVQPHPISNETEKRASGGRNITWIVVNKTIVYASSFSPQLLNLSNAVVITYDNTSAVLSLLNKTMNGSHIKYTDNITYLPSAFNGSLVFLTTSSQPSLISLSGNNVTVIRLNNLGLGSFKDVKTSLEKGRGVMLIEFLKSQQEENGEAVTIRNTFTNYTLMILGVVISFALVLVLMRRTI